MSGRTEVDLTTARKPDCIEARRSRCPRCERLGLKVDYGAGGTMYRHKIKPLSGGPFTMVETTDYCYFAPTESGGR